MIRTVTLNTGFDETLHVGPVDAGGVAELRSRSAVPSGKGINCARTVRGLGSPVMAYALIGESEQTRFRERLAADGVECRLIAVPYPTRTNVTIAHASGGGTHYRAAGFTLTNAAPIAQLVSALERDIHPGDIVSLHGSTPGGVAEDAWMRMADAAVNRGALVVADVYGAPLLRLLEAIRVFACKPNAQEMRVLPGVVGRDADAADAAVRYLAARVELPLISMGADGMLFVDAGLLHQASLTPDGVRTLVGAGDASVAGLVTALAMGERRPRPLVCASIAAAVAHVEGHALTDLAARASELSGRVRLTPR